MIALVVPIYCLDRQDHEMVEETTFQWSNKLPMGIGTANIMVICDDGGDPNYKLMQRADYYVYHPRVGVADNMNIGWQLALDRGADYVIICDSDVRPTKGDIKDLCIPSKVAVPLCQGWPERASVAPMMVVPKEVALERGMYDSCGGRHSMKHFDADYQVRVRDIIEHVTSFEIEHLNGGNQTTGRYMTQCPCGRCNGY